MSPVENNANSARKLRSTLHWKGGNDVLRTCIDIQVPEIKADAHAQIIKGSTLHPAKTAIATNVNKYLKSKNLRLVLLFNSTKKMQK